MKRFAVLASLIAGCGIAAGPSSASSTLEAPAAPALTSITPAVADRGDLVTITGGGFGALNLHVTVGGDPVELISATGSRASFRVPALGAVGNVTVVARNPGGLVGRIGLIVRFDGAASAIVDEAAAVAAPIDGDGGTIAVEGMTLAIPPGAVPDGTTITATPLRRLRGSPFAAAPVGLKLEPSGLVLLQPASLTLPRPAGSGQVVGFGFNGDGDGLHLVPHRLAGNTVELKVWHFSGAGATTVSPSELQAALGYLPTPAHELAEQRIAGALASEATGGPPAGRSIFDALVAWRTGSVARGLDLARTDARLDFFELAFGEWLAWRSYAQEYLERFDASQRSFVATATGIDRAVATDAAAAVARVLLPRCTGPAVPLAALRDVIRLASAVNLDALPTDEEGAQDGSGRSLPDGRNLPTSCLDVQIVAIQHAAALARNRNNRVLARAQVVFWKGDPSGTIPLRYRLADTTAAPVPLSSGTSSNGTFETTVDPGTLGLRRLELTVELDSADTVLRTFFDQSDFSVPVRERLELQAVTPTTIGAGGSVSLRLRLAGDGMVGAVVPLTVGGPGSVTPATVTTDAGGEATAVYSVPADTMVTAASVNAALADGTSASVPITINTLVLVSVSPTTATLSPGQSVNLTATVTGTLVTSVTWTATSGEVISTGATTARYVAGTTPGTFSVTATSTDAPGASATVTVVIRQPNLCAAPGYALAGRVTRTHDGGALQSSGSAEVTLCFGSDGRTVSVVALSGTSRFSDSGDFGSVSCTGDLRLSVPRTGRPGEFRLSRYDNLVRDATGIISAGKLFAAWDRTCTNGDGSTSAGDTAMIFGDNLARHTIVGGRIVAVDFNDASDGTVTTGVLQPVP